MFSLIFHLESLLIFYFFLSLPFIFYYPLVFLFIFRMFLLPIFSPPFILIHNANLFFVFPLSPPICLCSNSPSASYSNLRSSRSCRRQQPSLAWFMISQPTPLFRRHLSCTFPRTHSDKLLGTNIATRGFGRVGNRQPIRDDRSLSQSQASPGIPSTNHKRERVLI